MKKNLAYLFLLIVLSSCGASVNSIVDTSLFSQPYQNPLIVIPYERFSTKNFTDKLADKIELLFKNDNKKVEFLLFEKSETGKLTLNSNEDIDAKINNAISVDKKDLILIFKPKHLAYYNNALQSITYEIVGIDISTKKEVWKAEFNSNSSVGPAFFADKSSKLIYEKLKADKVL